MQTIFKPVVATIGNCVHNMIGLLIVLIVGWFLLLSVLALILDSLKKTTLFSEFQRKYVLTRRVPVYKVGKPSP